jgi:hypothetical protein
MWITLTEPGGAVMSVNGDALVALRPSRNGGALLYFSGMNNSLVSEVTESVDTVLTLLGAVPGS